jgi:hypothetical protein
MMQLRDLRPRSLQHDTGASLWVSCNPATPDMLVCVCHAASPLGLSQQPLRYSHTIKAQVGPSCSQRVPRDTFIVERRCPNQGHVAKCPYCLPSL